MSTSRSILFFAKDKSPMVKFIQRSMKEIHKERYPKFKPVIVRKGQFKDVAPYEMYASMFVFPEGENLKYLNGEEVFGKKFEKYNSEYKLWASMGGSNTTYTDAVYGDESYYPIFYFRMLVEKIKRSGLKNDVLITCTTSSGGSDHRSYPIKIRKLWPGKFL